MGSIEYVVLQADDIERVVARTELLVAVQLHDRPYDARPSRRDLMSALAFPFEASDHEHWLAYEGDTLVGSATLDLPTRDNLKNAGTDIYVHPDHRGRGVGRRLTDHMTDRARARGRRRLVAEIVEEGTPEYPSDGAGTHLAKSLGAELALVDARRRLRLRDVGPDVPAQLLEAAEAASRGYDLVEWQNSAPDDLLDGIATLESRMVTDAPMGTLAWEPENYDAARWRAMEATVLGRGRRTYGCAAVHSDTGIVTGYTMTALDADVPEHAWQWTTIVLPEHRGHRLGVRMKAYIQLQLLEQEPEALTLDTWNAVENAPMIAVNEALGYRPLDVWGEWQLDLY